MPLAIIVLSSSVFKIASCGAGQLPQEVVLPPETFIVTDFTPELPVAALSHTTVKVFAVVILLSTNDEAGKFAGTTFDPTPPGQSPVNEQVVGAFVTDQVTVELPPLVTVIGLAEIVTTGLITVVIFVTVALSVEIP